MTTGEDIDMLAAEYVLGTLDASERVAVAARRLREPALDAAIVAWERRLAPLDAATAPATPLIDVLSRIEDQLDARLPSVSGRGDGTARILALERRVGFWRRTAAAASAIAAALALVVGLRETLLPVQQPKNFVAVFQKDDQQPAFLLSIDLETRQLVIRPVTAEPLRERTYQLWIVDPSVDPVPRSLGLIESSLTEPTRKTLASLEPDVLRRATFGISVEPVGGSPTGRPTGPALHGKLLPATN